MIDRCPKTMMLRELVVNAIEAACLGSPKPAVVEIEQRIVDGAPKLCIWNTGPGMSPVELDRICDIASSLGKAVSLDGNFGMGAKVASLPSNKNGLVIRSCKDGRVSQVVLGKQEGVYGRLMQDNAATGGKARVLDVTEKCRGGYDLSTEWTEVMLLGNRPDQDTVSDPYDNDPAMPADWVATTLGQRFFRLPAGLTLKLLAGVGANVERRIEPLSVRSGSFTNAESVPLPGGGIVHYYYMEKAPDREQVQSGLAAFRGVAGIVHKGEIYGLRQGHQWAVDAPSYGISFGARMISVFVELPDDDTVRPEAYRQYLRYTEGDQRQVLMVDFAETVRTAMPAWLRRIVNDLLPPQADYLAEVREELQQLVVELDIVRMAPPPPPPKTGASPSDAKAPDGPRPPPVRQYEKPPEIITLNDDTTIGERGLVARAARYFPASRQLFVNLRCPAVLRMDLHLQHVFADARDQERVKQLAREIAEWSIIRMVARALLYSMMKGREGWSEDDILRAQSPEALTLVADNYQIGLDTARRRLAVTLDPDDQAGVLAVEGVADGSLGILQRREVELSTGERIARRALELGRAPPSPFLRRLSEIAMRRRDLPTALEWARKAVDADPKDVWSHNHLAGTLLATGDVDGAEQAARRTLELAGDAPHPGYLQRMADVEARRRNNPAALEWARKAAAADPANAMSQVQVAGLLLASGDLDGADEAARRAIELGGEQPPSFALRRMSEVAHRRGEVAEAVAWAKRAVEADTGDAWSQYHLSGLVLVTDLDTAERAARMAVSLTGPNPPAAFLRRLSEVELRLRNLPGALDLAQRAVDADASDIWAKHHLATMLRRTGDIEGAEREVTTAITMAGEAAPSSFLRTLSEINAAKLNTEEATRLAQKAIDRDPLDAWAVNHMAGLLMTEGDLDAAEAAALHAVDLSKNRPVGSFLRRVSEIKSRRRDFPAALDLAQQAVAADGRDAWSQSHLAGLLLMTGDLDGAERAARLAMELETGLNTAQFEQLLQRIEARRAALTA